MPMWSSSALAMLSLSNFFLVLVVGLVDKTRGEVFAVGGAAGWRVPQAGKVNYTEWVAMLSTLNFGDTLLFTYATGEHNVVQVGEEDFRRCRATNPIATYTDGQTLINLAKEGGYWFICGFRGHCLQGQKFMVDVVTPAIRAPAPNPTSGSPSVSDPTGPRSSPPTNSAPSSGPLGSALAPQAWSSISFPAFSPSVPNPDNSARHLPAQIVAMVVFSLMGFFFV
ncbi:hypothetical protein R1sor_006979 [Riccia sorocarpa]|uniref:Phytocyanin domain-containing protein n=1 Tax=Riccia sorocarpa TaxID=122646 RepID=A0ABD3HPM8_9MARC